MLNITLIDNYDSFTFNLVHLIGALDGGTRATITVVRNDAQSVASIAAQKPDAIVLSPGPCTPRDAGICLEVINQLSATTPILGVCLGHQAIGEAFGGVVCRAPELRHGKLSTITHHGQGLFHGINTAFEATRYHSLIVARDSLPDVLAIDAETVAENGAPLIMALRHKTLPVYGVQFHPESILSQHGETLVRNFLNLADDWNTHKRSAA